LAILSGSHEATDKNKQTMLGYILLTQSLKTGEQNTLNSSRASGQQGTKSTWTQFTEWSSFFFLKIVELLERKYFLIFCKANQKIMMNFIGLRGLNM
jgi:hypothetical protein